MSKKVPVVVAIHGGPEAQAVVSFNPQFQLWVSRLGACVLAPNVRGSSGYGKTYLQLDNGSVYRYSCATFSDWLPTGDGMLVLTRFGESNQVHRVLGPGLMREQLTFYSEPVAEARMSPFAKDTLLLRRDVGGNERFQLYARELQNGNERLLTDGVSRNESMVLERQTGRLLFSSAQRNGKDLDLYVWDPKSPNTRQELFVSEGKWNPLAVSDDGRTALVMNYVSINDSSLYLLRLSGESPATEKDLLRVHPAARVDGPVGIKAAVLTSDGKYVYVSSDQGQEFARLLRIDVQSG